MSARWAALVLLLLSVVPATAQVGRPKPDGTAWDTTSFHQDAARLASAASVVENSLWYGRFAGISQLEKIDLTCPEMRDNTLAFVKAVSDGDASVDFGNPLPGISRYGEYFANGQVVINATNSSDGDWKALIHEAQHWASVGEDKIASGELELDTLEKALTYGAAQCISFVREDEDDPNPPDPGGTTCTDEEYTYTEWDWVYTEIEAGSCVGVSPVRWPWEEGDGDEELHCTPAKWGYVLMEVEKTGVRTVCVPTSN